MPETGGQISICNMYPPGFHAADGGTISICFFPEFHSGSRDTKSIFFFQGFIQEMWGQ
jgi:hypothetical protein